MEDHILDDSVISPEVNLVPADKGKRFANLLIDYIGAIIFMAIVFLGLDFSGLLPVDAFDDRLSERFMGGVTYVSYYLLMETMTKGKSLGKFITKTRVVTFDGYQPNFVKILGRSFARIVPFEAFSYLGQKKTGWHDDWSKTFVIDERKSTLSDDGFIQSF